MKKSELKQLIKETLNENRKTLMNKENLIVQELDDGDISIFELTSKDFIIITKTAALGLIKALKQIKF